MNQSVQNTMSYVRLTTSCPIYIREICFKLYRLANVSGRYLLHSNQELGNLLLSIIAFKFFAKVLAIMENIGVEMPENMGLRDVLKLFNHFNEKKIRHI